MTPGRTGLDHTLTILRRRQWLALFLFAASATAVVTITRFLPALYESTATILVERQQVPEEFVRSTVTTEVDRRLQTITQTVMSRSRLVELIQKFNLYAEMRATSPIDLVVEHMRRSIQFELRRGDASPRGESSTAAFAITYRGEDPRTVALVTNELASMYIDEDLKMRERQSEGTAEFLEGQLEQQLRSKLEEQEAKVRDFKEKYLGELPQQEPVNLSTLERLNGQLQSNAERQAGLMENRQFLTQQLAQSTSSPLDESAGPELLVPRIATLKGELATLRKRYTDKYPDVVQLKAEIAGLEEQLRAHQQGEESAKEKPGGGTVPPESTTLDYGAELNKVNVELRTLQAEEQSLKRSIAEYQKRVENTPKRAQELQGLARDYETTQEVYQSLLKRYEEARLAQQLEHRQKGEQFRVLDPALVPEEPAAPKRGRLLFAGLLLSLGLTGGVVSLREILDTSFHSVDDVRSAYRVPVLSTVQRIVLPADRRRQRALFTLGATASVAALVLVAAVSWWVAHDNLRLVNLIS